MPIPFDDVEDQNTQPGVVSWLRFVEDANGGGVDAALFQTSEEGEPVDFCFTRAAFREFDGLGSDAKGKAVFHLLRSFFRKSLLRRRWFWDWLTKYPHGC